MKHFLLALAVAYTMPLALHANFIVTQEGKPQSEIIVGESPEKPVATAAQELQLWIREISGAELPILTKPDSLPQRIILNAGTIADTPYAADIEKLKDTNGYAIRQKGNELHLIAATPKGVLNSIYKLLMDNTDIIWARPNVEFGTIYTPKSTLIFTQTDLIDIPKFKMNGWQFGYGAKQCELLWSVRNRANWTNMSCTNTPLNDTYGMFKEAYYGHNINGLYIKGSKYYNDHPEFYPLINGKRVNPLSRPAHTQLCFTNKEMIAAFINEFDHYASARSDCRMFGVFAEDNYDQCQCLDCKADITLPDGSILKFGAPDFFSTRFFIFLNQIAEHAKQKFPDKLISTYAYLATEIPPRVPVMDNIVVLSCPIYKNVKFPVTSPQNADTFMKLAGWLEKTPNIIMYEYFGLTTAYPRPADINFALDFQYEYNRGVRYGHSEIVGDDVTRTHTGKDNYIAAWDCNSIYFWVMAQLFWNPFQNVQQLRDDYLGRVFHDAADDVKEYLACTEKAWHASSELSRWSTSPTNSWISLHDLNLRGQCAAALQRARKKPLGDKSRIMLERLAKHFEDNPTFRNYELLPKIRADLQNNPQNYKNLITNSDFEQLTNARDTAPMEDWVGSVFPSWNFWRDVKQGAYGCAPTSGIGGSKAAFMEGTGFSCFITKIPPVKTGELYYVSVMAMITDEGDIPNVLVRWQNDKSQWTAARNDVKLFSNNLKTNEWRLFDGIAEVPAGASRLLVLPGSDNLKGRILFDNVCVYKLDSLPPTQ